MEGETSRSGQQPQKRPKQRRASTGISYENSVMNLSMEGRETLRVKTRKSKRSLNSIPGNSCAVFDNAWPDYNWLQTGWIVEERVKPHNRLYRYYYNPLGQMYNTRYAVERIYADIKKDRGINVIHDEELSTLAT
ncbi:hypothetical protein V5N11_005957 [Cardamine amara subsp. amara]|uniref:Transposase n=1 Tax=Cardamine amara subsp. amara TaxID=228776 RepID=A0ABD0Z1D8_CARAN